MNCPNCSNDMARMTVDAHLSAAIDIDLCTPCQAFWFDKYESLKLAPASTLKLIKLIGETSIAAKPALTSTPRCPRCSTRLRLTNDMQRNTRFRYWRCGNGHGRFIGFFDFLREKNFIRPLSAREIQELRKNIHTVHCSSCGAPVDLVSSSACSHCGSPISMLDMKQPQELLNQLQQAAEPGPSQRVQRIVDAKDLDMEWWGPASASGVVEAGLTAVVRWLTKSGF